MSGPPQLKSLKMGECGAMSGPPQLKGLKK
jgi:hypothetical protein